MNFRHLLGCNTVAFGIVLLQLRSEETILQQEMINQFLCLLIVFLKSKIHRLHFQGHDYIE